MSLNKVNRCVLTDGAALVSILLIGLVASWTIHVPLAMTLVQILAIALIAQALPLYILSHEKGRICTQHVTKRQLHITLLFFGLLAALIAYAGYLLFFAFHDLSPAYIDTGHPLYMQATTLAFMTIVLPIPKRAVCAGRPTPKGVHRSRLEQQKACGSLERIIIWRFERYL